MLWIMQTSERVVDVHKLGLWQCALILGSFPGLYPLCVLSVLLLQAAGG